MQARYIHHAVFLHRRRIVVVLAIHPADALPQTVFLQQELVQALNGERLHARNHRVKAIHPLEHKGTLAADELSTAVPPQLVAQSVRQQQLQLGCRVEDPAALVSTQLPGANPAHLLHLGLWIIQVFPG